MDADRSDRDIVTVAPAFGKVALVRDARMCRRRASGGGCGSNANPSALVTPQAPAAHRHLGRAERLGPTALALKHERGADGWASFVKKFRVYDIADQDGLADWMRGEFPGLSYILRRQSLSRLCGWLYHCPLARWSQASSGPLPLKPAGGPVVISKVPLADCRVVRGCFGSPIDGSIHSWDCRGTVREYPKTASDGVGDA